MIIGAFIWGVIYAKRAKLPTWQLADLIAVYLPLGYALARVGCLLNGCCYGVPSRLPWAFVIPAVDNLPRHPTQVYAIIASLLILSSYGCCGDQVFPGFIVSGCMWSYTPPAGLLLSFPETRSSPLMAPAHRPLSPGDRRDDRIYCLLA